MPFDYDEIDNSLSCTVHIDDCRVITVLIPLSANHVAVKDGEVWSIRNIYKRKPIQDGYRQINGVHDGHYIVGK